MKADAYMNEYLEEREDKRTLSDEQDRRKGKETEMVEAEKK